MKKIIAWIFIFFSSYCLLEIFFLHYAASLFPVSSLGLAGPRTAIFLQYSKAAIVPKNYIGIFGDSYAYGQGDWLLNSEHDIKPVFSAAHLLHKSTRRDVVSFGFPASDSIRANNVLPAALLAYARQTREPYTKDPATIIVYFYEGNDLDDNVEVAQKRILNRLDSAAKIYDAAYFQNTIIPQILNEDDFIKNTRKISFSDQLFFWQFAKQLCVEFYRHHILGKKPAPWKITDRGETTRARIAGDIVTLPDKLQSPALTLTNDEMTLGLYMFEQSLVYLRQQFPDTHIGIAYIPSVLSNYEIVSPQINDYYKDSHNDKGRRQEAVRIRTNSDFICSRVRNISQKLGLGFIDTRARLRAAAKNNYVHGPIDWHHFNQLGYEIFTQDLLLLLTQVETTSGAAPPECRWEE
jgi:hypothetical protein